MSTIASKRTDILLDVGTNEVEIFEFLICGQSYGINVAKIQQIIKREGININRLDFSPHGVAGTMQFRGKPVMVVDFHVILNFPEREQDRERQLIMVTEFNRVTTGFIVDGASRIHRVNWSEFSPLQTGMTAAPYVTGVIKVENRLIMVLDIEHILAKISPKSSAVTTTVNLTETAGPRLNPHIIFADDSAMIRAATVRMLGEVGFSRITVATDGNEALTLIKAAVEKAGAEKQPLNNYLGVVLTDIEMPVMDGLSLCKAIRTELNLKELPVIVYSSLINEAMGLKCKAVGCTAYISKPEISRILPIIQGLDPVKILPQGEV